MALVAFVVAAVAYGRSEGERAVDVQQRGLLAVRAAVGARLVHPTQSVYDPGSGLQCLVYRVGRRPSALELCFDSAGGLIEAVDRRGKERISTVRWSRSDAPLHIPPSEVVQAVKNVIPADRLEGLLP